LAHQLLPAEDQTKADEVRRTLEKTCEPRMVADYRTQDQPYLSPIIEEIEAELKERADLESMVVERRK